MRQGELVLNSAVSRQAKANKSSLVFWLNEIVLKSAISRQAKANKFSLVFWLNEIVGLPVAGVFHLPVIGGFVRGRRPYPMLVDQGGKV